jgi:hypothetical protein
MVWIKILLFVFSTSALGESFIFLAVGKYCKTKVPA